MSKEESGPSMGQRLIAEATGTFVLVFFGCGAVMQSKYTEAMVGLGQPAMTWVLGGVLAVYTCGSISGGHLNPAVSLAFTLARPKDFPFADLLPYAIAQTFGAFVAAAVNYGIFSESIKAYEEANGFIRDESGYSFAGAFGCYWSGDFVRDETHAVLMEVMGTAMLTFTVFSITHPSNNVPGAIVPVLVGVAIGSIIAIIGSLSGGAINPARDVGPRLFTLLFGWGQYGFEGTWVYSVGPFIGGPLGAMLADGVVRQNM